MNTLRIFVLYGSVLIYNNVYPPKDYGAMRNNYNEILSNKGSKLFLCPFTIPEKKLKVSLQSVYFEKNNKDD